MHSHRPSRISAVIPLLLDKSIRRPGYTLAGPARQPAIIDQHADGTLPEDVTRRRRMLLVRHRRSGPIPPLNDRLAHRHLNWLSGPRPAATAQVTAVPS
jgi:hypothetical protein